MFQFHLHGGLFRPSIAVGLIVLGSIAACSPDQLAAEQSDGGVGRILDPWAPGFLDVHHINTGRGDAAFFVFPDGTTMLFDAGDRDVNDIGRYAPLKIAEQKPNDQRTPGYWISEYIKNAMPPLREPSIDYAVVSHFHSDHFGNANNHRALSESGKYRLSGFTEVGNLVPIGMLLDRGYPEYSDPVDLRKYYHTETESPFANYLSFAEEKEQEGSLRREQIKPGSASQIVTLHDQQYSSFNVRNIKANASIWTGDGDEAKAAFDSSDMPDERGRFNENSLSVALRLSYGKFDYFTGGDNTGYQGAGIPAWFDVESLIGAAIGRTDVTTLNHHGNRDATNANFLAALAPRVIVQQTWFSDHPGGEVVYRLLSQDIWSGPRDIFSTSMAEETKVAIGPGMTKGYTSFEGHVVVRVEPDGESYYVYVLDDRNTELIIKSVHGPYEST